MNMYCLSVVDYSKLLANTITATFQKSIIMLPEELNTEAKFMTEDLKLDDKPEMFTKRDLMTK